MGEPDPVELFWMAVIGFIMMVGYMWVMFPIYGNAISIHEDITVPVTVLDKNVMANRYGEPVYTVTFDSPSGNFVYAHHVNCVDVYHSVEIGKTYNCTYDHEYIKYLNWNVTSTDYNFNPILKINGVTV